jgi:hypothetical protein
MTDDREREQIAAVLDAIAEDEDASDLVVEVQGDSIVVTKRDTDFSVTYEKRPENPHLTLTQSWTHPHETTPAVSEFRARAFQAAVAKARGTMITERRNLTGARTLGMGSCV